jgi:predicted nucleic acid-binding protein
LLVVDSAVVVTACLAASGLDALTREELVAPPLMWSEATSVLHELRWRRQISEDLAQESISRLESAPIATRSPTLLHQEAWQIADAFGWAKTYDAEYVALAQLLKCRLLTLDARLMRTASRLVTVIGPADV